MKSNIGRQTVGAEGDVFRLQILCYRRARPEDADVRGKLTSPGSARVKVRKVDGRYGGPGDAAGKTDQADAAFGVYRVLVVRLALVGDKHLLAAWRKEQHVRQGPDGHLTLKDAVRIEENNLPRVGFRVGLDGYGHEPSGSCHAVGLGTKSSCVDSERLGGVCRI